MNRNSISMSHNFTRQTASFRRIRTMTMISLLAAVAFVFAFFEFPVPLSPAFARMDLSDFPALVGAMALGPWAGVLVELVKNLLGLLGTSTGGVGELANFLMGGAMAYLLSSRLSLSVPESHRLMPCGSRTIPPVGTFTPPRRSVCFFSYRLYSWGGLPEKSAITAWASAR